MQKKKNLFFTLSRSRVFTVPAISGFSNKFALLNASKVYSGVEFNFVFSCVRNRTLRLFSNKKKNVMYYFYLQKYVNHKVFNGG